MGIVSRSGGSGAGVGAVLFDSTLAVDTATIDTGANGIAQTQTDLFVFFTGRTDVAGATDLITVTLNGDSSAIYDLEVISGSNVTASAGVRNASAGWIDINAHGNGGTAGYSGVLRLIFPNYTGTTFNKVGEGFGSVPDGTAANQSARGYALGYRSTAAISRLAVAGQAAAKFKAGSRLRILGF